MACRDPRLEKEYHLESTNLFSFRACSLIAKSSSVLFRRVRRGRKAKTGGTGRRGSLERRDSVVTQALLEPRALRSKNIPID